jgi:hypothetical protein
MNTISDVMIHINESLSKEARSSLENTMRKVEGVVSPGFQEDKQHLLVIAYNPEKTSTTVLLEKARAEGYTAQLVGM